MYHPCILQCLIPDEWVDMLSATQKLFPQAIIAGGCLRDLDYGKSPKDVDIFIKSSIDDNFSKIQQIGFSGNYTLGPPKLSVSAMEEYSPEIDTNKVKRNIRKTKRQLLKEKRSIYSIYKIEYKGFKYEFIFGCEDTCSIDKFDLSFCQISFDGNQINRTEHYIKTLNTNIVEIIYCDRKDYQQGRIDKFAQKFPELKFKTFKQRKKVKKQ